MKTVTTNYIVISRMINQINSIHMLFMKNAFISQGVLSFSGPLLSILNFKYQKDGNDFQD